MKKNKKKRREREGGREKRAAACGSLESIRGKDEKRRDERREDAIQRCVSQPKESIERCRGYRQEARLNHQKAILLTVTSIQRTERPGDARPPENRGHVTDPPHSDP